MDFLILFLVSLIIVGVVLYLVQEFLPLDPRLKLVIQAIVVIVWLIWLLNSGLPGLEFDT